MKKGQSLFHTYLAILEEKGGSEGVIPSEIAAVKYVAESRASDLNEGWTEV